MLENDNIKFIDRKIDNKIILTDIAWTQSSVMSVDCSLRTAERLSVSSLFVP
jgi:hypothetical protein